MRGLAIFAVACAVAGLSGAAAQSRSAGRVAGLEDGALCYRSERTEEGVRCDLSLFEFPVDAGPVSASNRVRLPTKDNRSHRWVLRSEVIFEQPQTEAAVSGMLGGVGGGGASDMQARRSIAPSGGATGRTAPSPMEIPDPQLSTRTSGESGNGRVRVTPASTPVVPRCTRNLGTISIQNGDTYQGWRGMRLQPPAGVLRAIVQQSGCFTIVERGSGLEAAGRERELAGGGQLQRGSNVGGGQIRAADYVLLADVVGQDNNAGGGGVGAVLGGVIGGVVGGVGTRSQQATTTLSLMNVRTSETATITEGNARNRNITWGGGAFLGGGGASLGGYTDTEIGRVVTVAFIDAYTQMVAQLGALDTSTTAAAAASQRTYRTTQATPLRSRPGGGLVLRNLPSGSTVYPTGERDGMWWRVFDENGNEGWVNNDFLQPVQ